VTPNFEIKSKKLSDFHYNLSDSDDEENQTKDFEEFNPIEI
jgi:hypothetical protein